MSAVAPVIDYFPARTQPGRVGRGTRPPLPTRPKPPRATLSPPALAVMAEGLASVVSTDAVPLLPGVARGYSKLLATDDYDVWLIAWAATGALDLHDHGGSSGVVRIVAGELMETYTDLVERQPLRSATFGPGETVVVPATRVHEVWNPGPRPALSIHIYSPPLTTMTFYDDRPDHFLAPRRTECGELPG